MLLNHSETTELMELTARELMALGHSAYVEYPAFLVIEHNGREYHAGFTFDSDYELNDTMGYEFYEWNDGVIPDGLVLSLECHGLRFEPSFTQWVAQILADMEG